MVGGDTDHGGNPVKRVDVNGQTVDKNSLKAEASANLILKDGVVTVGSNPAKSVGSMTGNSDGGSGAEPGKVGSIHLHPTAGEMNVTVKYESGQLASVPIHGGAVSTTDYTQRAKDFESGAATPGIRSVMVDEKNIYLYNSASSQTITIPRQ